MQNSHTHADAARRHIESAIPAPAMSPIDLAMERLRSANNSLASSSDALVNRLETVLRSVPLSDEKEAGRLVGAPTCQLQEEILREAERIENLTAFLDSAFSRLQL